MTEKELIDIASAMRGKQKEYYRTFDRKILEEAKRMERKFDKALEEYMHPCVDVKQKDLFD